MNRLQTQVVVVGAGPCGVTIANYLGQYGVRTVLLDRAPDILDHPRAVGADDETLRSWQAVGLAEEVLADMVQNVPARYFSSTGRRFAQVRPAAQPFGWPRRNIFLQPLTEASLRRGLARFPSVDMRLGWDVEAFEQDGQGVRVRASAPDGPAEIACDYLVGADGGRSTVRKLLGVELTGKTLASKWLVIDVEEDALYSPFTDVHCHPVRPHICINLPYGYRRFEFMLLPQDSEEAVQTPEHIAGLLRPHYPGSMPLPKVKRSRVYLHHSRIAERFQVGRVFLAGDAAHLQPPFFGQGMNSGIRDATNIAWKLAAVLKGHAAAPILDSYDQERRDHALAMVNIATWLGSFYRPRNRLIEAMRDAFFRAIQGLPSVRDYILQLRFKPMPRYVEGIVDHRSSPPPKASPVGRMFMQPRVETAERRQLKLDDAIGPWFALIGVNVDPLAALGAQERGFWKALGATAFHVVKSRRGPRTDVPQGTGAVLLEDLEGAFRDWLSAHPDQEIIVLRPDRYVAAVCRRDELPAVTARLRERLGTPMAAVEAESKDPAQLAPAAVATEHRKAA